MLIPIDHWSYRMLVDYYLWTKLEFIRGSNLYYTTGCNDTLIFLYQDNENHLHICNVADKTIYKGVGRLITKVKLWNNVYYLSVILDTEYSIVREAYYVDVLKDCNLYKDVINSTPTYVDYTNQSIPINLNLDYVLIHKRKITVKVKDKIHRINLGGYKYVILNLRKFVCQHLQTYVDRILLFDNNTNMFEFSTLEFNSSNVHCVLCDILTYIRTKLKKTDYKGHYVLFTANMSLFLDRFK